MPPMPKGSGTEGPSSDTFFALYVDPNLPLSVIVTTTCLLEYTLMMVEILVADSSGPKWMLNRQVVGSIQLDSYD